MHTYRYKSRGSARWYVRCAELLGSQHNKHHPVVSYHLVVSFAALVQTVAQGSLAVREELQAVPYLRLHSAGFREACLQRSEASLQLNTAGQRKKNDRKTVQVTLRHSDKK